MQHKVEYSMGPVGLVERSRFNHPCLCLYLKVLGWKVIGKSHSLGPRRVYACLVKLTLT